MEATALQHQGGMSAVRMLTTISGLVFVAQGVAAAATEQNTKYAGSTGDVLADGLLAGALLLSIAGLEALRRVLSTGIAALAMAGQLALTISIAATIAAGREALDAVFIGGALAWLVGLTGIAIAAGRCRERHWRAAIALPPSGVVTLAFADAGGPILIGLIWLVMGTRLRSVRAS